MRKVILIHSAVIAVITAIMIVSILSLVSVNYVLSDRIRSVSATDTAAEEALSASLRHDHMIASYVRVPSPDEDFEDDEVTIILDGEHSGTGVIGSHYDYDEVMVELEKVGNLDLDSVEELFECDPGEIVLEPTHRKMFDIKLIEPGKDKVIEAVEDLLELDMILSAEAKYNYETVDMSTSSSSDPYYDQQWGLNGTL